MRGVTLSVAVAVALVVLVGLTASCSVGSAVLDAEGAEGAPLATRTDSDAAHLKTPVPKRTPPPSEGRELDEEFCAACHGRGGRGAVARSLAHLDVTLAELIGATTEGAISEYTTAIMPAFRDHMTPKEIQVVSTYMLELSEEVKES